MRGSIIEVLSSLGSGRRRTTVAADHVAPPVVDRRTTMSFQPSSAATQTVRQVTVMTVPEVAAATQTVRQDTVMTVP